MVIYPVILCGGAGSRLWPASRPSRPKPFIRLTGERSLFQQAVSRVAPLAHESACLVVVAGAAHRDWVADQLAELGQAATVLLEPEGRDTAAAMAVAAAWILARDPLGVAAVAAADHHLPDAEAFRTAVGIAAYAALAGRIVTLGVRATEPSCAYGYIQPSGPGLSDVRAFIEKPDAVSAGGYIAAGYLWNSGNFIVAAATLIDELKRHAPAVEVAARAALPGPTSSGVIALTDAFLDAPAISIDYAVMQHTAVASVLEVGFVWSDMGAWDAVARTGEGMDGRSVLEDCQSCLVRTSKGVVVAAVGVSNLAIIAEPDAVLVCDLSRAQDVQKLIKRLKAEEEGHRDLDAPREETLKQSADRFARWMQLDALPLWASLGVAADGSFEDALTLDGGKIDGPRRARVQARQVYVYAKAGELGWSGPWKRIASDGLEAFFDRHGRDDGLVRTLLSRNGATLDDTAALYDQAFTLLALATARAAGLEGAFKTRATGIRDRLKEDWLPQGGLREAGDHPYQANAHMHLLEACMAWEEVGGDPLWAEMADEVAALALSRFIDAERGVLREFFDADWTPAAGPAGRLVEPGHQFEWAWLLTRRWRSRQDRAALDAARMLYRSGMIGVDRQRGVAIDELDDSGAARSARARLWPQTEWLKAALILSEEADPADRDGLLDDAASALRGLLRYLEPSGLWRDKLTAENGFIDEPAPASSFYHIMAAFDQLCASSARLDLADIRLR